MISCLKEDAIIDAMTLADFLGYCEICYRANDYRQYASDASPMDKYKAMADDRHDGLLDLTLDDPTIFLDWHQNRSGAGHPFEICRGGNSTNISLHVLKRDRAWQLFLAGFSPERVVETAKMALALYQRDIPFALAMKEEMLMMLLGEDFVGIVPDDIILGYNHDSFPLNDQVFSFTYLWTLEELDARIADKISWYPIVRLSLNNRYSVD
jgi:hypothetical protein